MGRPLPSVLALSLLAISGVGPVYAADVAATTVSDAGLFSPGFHILAGPRFGGLVPFSKASPAWNVGLEIGSQFALDGVLGAVFEVDIRRPSRTVSLTDPRVGTQAFDAKISNTELALFLGPRVMTEIAGFIVPYAAIGLGLHLVQSEVSGGPKDAPFDRTSEQSARFGFGVRSGVGIENPFGLFALTLDADFAGLDHRVTGDSNLSSLAIGIASLFSF